MKRKIIAALSCAVIACAAAAVLFACGDDPAPPPATYTVTYSDGGDQSVEDTRRYGSNSVVTLQENTFTNEGYKFTGWTYGGETYAAGDTFTMSGENVTFTAKWETAYSVTYGSIRPRASYVDPNLYTANEQVVILPKPESFRPEDGFVFAGWTYGTETLQPGDVITMPAGDVQLAAVWERTYVSVNFYLTQEDYAEMNISQVYANKNFAFAAGSEKVLPTVEEKDFPDGMVFAGWYYNVTDESGSEPATTRVQFTADYEFTEDDITSGTFSVYAMWTSAE